MTNEHDVTEIKIALLKSGAQRSYDDVVMLKSYLSKTDFVKNIVGSSLLPKQMDELCRSLVLESFNVGDTIIKQGEPGDRMYVILTGLCEVRLKQNVELAHGLSEVREKALYQCHAFNHFGEKALQNDEPRGASVVAIEYSDCISIHKFTYSTLIKNALAEAESIASRNDQPGTKSHCLKILGKKTQYRTKLEIEAVAGYLDWRIPFFRNFTKEQQIELCRVSQAVSIYGETVLFKQGSVGQAFYIVLTGTVEVWVASADEIALSNAIAQSALANTINNSASKTAEASVPLKHGLGNKVAILSVGDTFGERALENEDSKRMASICTCESLTDLIVIAREDYYKLVSALTNTTLMNKITLLRKTDIFRNIDAVHLKELARFMEPKRYELDEIILVTGKRATEMIITDIGECVVEVDIATFTSGNVKSITNGGDATAGGSAIGYDDDSLDSGTIESMMGKDKSKTIMEAGRIAPHSVLASYITQVQSLYDHVYNPETVVATTLVTGYAIGLHDFFTNMNNESKLIIVDVVKNYQACTIPGLWETDAFRVGDKEWRTRAAWEKYCKNLRKSGNNNMTYIESLKSFSNLYLTVDSGNVFQNSSGQYQPTAIEIAKYYPDIKMKTHHHDHDHDISGSHSHTMSYVGGTSSDGYGSKGPAVVDMTWGIIKEKKSSKFVCIEDLDYDMNAVHPIVEKALSAAHQREKRREIEAKINAETDSRVPSFSSNTDTTSGIPQQETPDEMMAKWLSHRILEPEDKPYRYAFSLVHVHQKRVAQTAASLGSQRQLKCYMRLCGTLASCSNAKEAAEMQMQSALLMQYDSDLSKEEQLKLKWKAFPSFESMPLQNSDMFFIYCRGVPVEYACITPEKDLMDFNFPAFCKQKNQFYSCVVMRGLTPPEPILPETTEKRKRRSRKPWKDGVYGISYEDTDDEGSDDEYTKIERENNITANGLPSHHPYKTAKFNLQLQQPVFLQELNSFVETLATSATQLTCILFGKITQSKMVNLDPIHATYNPIAGEMLMTAPGFGLTGGLNHMHMDSSTINMNTLPGVSIAANGSSGNSNGNVAGTTGTAASAGSYGMSMTSTHTKMSKYTGEDKRICIFPLYEWLPIVETTLKEHDITQLANLDRTKIKNNNHHADLSNTTTGTMSSTLGRTATGTGTLGAATLATSKSVPSLDIKLTGPDGIEKSFKEAGMLSPPMSKKNNKSAFGGSKSLSELPYLDKIASKVTGKGLTKTVDMNYTKILEEQKLQAEMLRLELRKKRLFDMRPENRLSPRTLLRREKELANQATKEQEEEDNTDSIMDTEEKKQSLKDIINERRRMIALNDKLCYDEGKLKPKKSKLKNYTKINGNDNDNDSQSDEEEFIGDLSFLQQPTVSNQLDGVYQAGKVDINSYKRGVTVVRSNNNGDFGPGGMGMLGQRMSMYDSLNHLPACRNLVEKELKNKKKEKDMNTIREKEKALLKKVTSDDQYISPEKTKKILVSEKLRVLNDMIDKTITY